MQNTSEKMRLLYDKWQKTGLSKMAFCKGEGLSYTTFHYWHKQFSKVSESGFSEIPLKNNTLHRCELVFPSGVRMVFDTTVPITYLKGLLF